MNVQKIKCFFGYHKYTIPHKRYSIILLCRHCKRFGYRKWSNEYELWFEYDERGNMIYSKDDDGYEIWYEYDEKGEFTRCRWM